MKSYLIIFVIACLVSPYAYAENETVNERLIRVETSVKSVGKQLEGTNKRIDDTNKQIEFLRNDIHSLRNDMSDLRKDVSGLKGSITHTLFLFLFAILALIIWDRKTTVKPYSEKIDELYKKVAYIWEHFGLDKQKDRVVKPA